MTQKLTIRKGGASGATIQDFSAMIRMFDATGERAIFGGMKFNNGDSASGQAILLDEDSVVPNGDANDLTIYGFNEVIWSDDAPGYEAWLSVGRVSNKDWARPAPRTAGVTRQGTVQWVDMNADLKGIVLLESVARPEETAAERMQWVIETFYQGDPRDSTDIQYGHLIGDGVGFDNVMDAFTYKANTEAISIIEECNNRAGKIFGVVPHEDSGADHKCFEWIGETNHTLYVSPLSISDVPADVDGVTTFEPVWRNGTASTEDPTQAISGVGLTYGTDNDQAVFVTDSALVDQFDYYVGAFTFDRARTETWASARAENMLSAYGKEYVTVQPSILIPATLHNTVRAGMSISVRSDAAFGGEDQGIAQMKRISSVEFEPAGWKGEALYLWANLQLDQPLRILTQPDPNHDMGPQPPGGSCSDVTATLGPHFIDGSITDWHVGGNTTGFSTSGTGHDGTNTAGTGSGLDINCFLAYEFTGTFTAGKTYTLRYWYWANFTNTMPYALGTGVGFAVAGPPDTPTDGVSGSISTVDDGTWRLDSIEWTPTANRTSVVVRWGGLSGATGLFMVSDGSIEECTDGEAPPASDDDTGDPGSGECFSPCNHKHPAQTAAVTPITDSGGYYTSTNLEGALQELGPTAVDQFKVKVTTNDTTPRYLGNKLVAGTNISITEDNDGADETLTFDVSAGAPLSDDTPLVESGSGSAGTSTDASRSDHVHPADGGGGGGGGAPVLPLDVAPGSPSTWDDEFDAGSLDAKWTNPGTSASGQNLTLALANDWLTFEPATSGSSNTGKHVFFIRQNGPTGDFTVMGKIIDSRAGDDTRVGIFVAKTGGKAYVIGSQRQNGRLANMNGVSTYSETADWSGYDGFDTFVSPAWPGPIWFKLEYASGTLSGYYSASGVVWTLLGSTSSVTQPDRIGLCIWANTGDTLADHLLGADWFRVTEP